MKLLMALVDALVGFVQRNPLLILVILLLAIGAPALLRDIATVVLYVIGGLVAVLVILVLIFYLRIRAARRQMEKQFEQFGQQFGGDPFGSAGRNGFGGAQHGFGGRPPHGDAPREGEVHVYQTHDAPEKRISSDVGDYVDFEETKTDD